MKRWVPTAILAGTLFLVNVVTRFITGKLDQSNTIEAQDTLDKFALIAMGVVGVVMMVACLWWAARQSIDKVIAELGSALLVATVLSVFISPLLFGFSPFSGGVELILKQFLMYLAVGAVGAGVGYFILMVLAKDYRSQSLKRVEQYYGRKTGPAKRR